MAENRKDKNQPEPARYPNPEIWERDDLSNCASTEEVMRLFREIRIKYKEALDELKDK